MRRIHSDVTEIYPGYRLWSVEGIKAFPSSQTSTLSFEGPFNQINKCLFDQIMGGNVAYKLRKVDKLVA